MFEELEFENFRAVDARFCLSGHWPWDGKQAEWLVAQGIVAVLDLEWVPDTSGPKGAPWWAPAVDGLRRDLAEHGIEYRAIPMFDGLNDDLRAIYDEGQAVIGDWLARHREGRILVKCYAGRSRSVSMLANWYCLTGMTWDEALARIESADGEVYLSTSLEDYLLERWLHRMTEVA